ncbi:HelD family protein [Actinomadura parmotrematis]|uniref:AAA family ATPase n=1 Tax=Actinomadura parmotrematis TaxID=2864039 RepID=A0ABS7FPS8_9ACTN|nr:AAA family ATPase [Actinomadura parmotrematis]MBW8482387.1 AAA family ATPase [Actinomadura parmotrematis]
MGDRQVNPSPEDVEQRYVTRVYARLDAERAAAGAALAAGPGAGGGAGFQARVEREVSGEEAARRLARLDGVERALCFGRIDHRDGGGTFHLGRIGLRDEDHEPLLIDWRAPAARPFYTATASAPGTLARRRHLHLRGREVVRLDDEVFDLDGLGAGDRGELVGEAALLAALRTGRTGRMGDVVATIQEEQDQVIRSALQGVLVVQGGPGTGKTVAALHRAAYLLYTHRDVLERRGVLVVGPNATFLRYIEEVLPGLGETDVVLTSVGELFPGVRAIAHEAPEAAVVKGDLRMAEAVRAAVLDRQRAPEDGLSVEVDGLTLHADAAAVRKARDRARAVRAPHNVQRRLYAHDLLEALAQDRADQYDRIADEPLERMAAEGGAPTWLQELMDESDNESLFDAEDLRLAKEELWADPRVRSAIDELWPELTPQALLEELFASPEALHRLACTLTDAERDLLARPAGSPWTVSDVPLLDEAAEQLGEDDVEGRARARAAELRRAEEERYAREVLDSAGADARAAERERADEEVLIGDRLRPGAAYGQGDERVGSVFLAERHHDDGPYRTTAQRAAADRTWAYGHVIVDEAQELSEMAWRAVMRRVPTRSVTAVGDTAQTGSPAGARSWGAMLDRYVPGRWREQRLLVNYRTPAAIARVAADVLAAVAPGETPPVPVRDDGAPPVAVRLPVAELPGLVAAELAGIGAGRLAVISSGARHAAVLAALPDAARGAAPEALDAAAVVLTAEEAKGLEFDAVIVVDPAGIVAESPRGGHDLYVAVTRPTRRLTVVHAGDLPECLARLRDAGGPGA